MISNNTNFLSGATMEEEFKTDPVSGEALSRAARTETSWDANGCEKVTVSVSRNDGPWTTESIIRKDFLGRTVITERAGYNGAMLVTSNAFDTAGRYVYTRNPDGSAVAYAYDELGNSAGTVRIGAGQTLDFNPLDFTLAGVAALDKYVIEEALSWKDESDLGLSAYGIPTACWDCSASISHLPGQGAVTTSVARVQLTGLSPACVARAVTTDADGVTRVTTESVDDASTATKTVMALNTTTTGTDVSVRVAGYETERTNSLGSAVAYMYDGFGRQTAVTQTAGERILQNVTGYHAVGSVAYTTEICGTVSNVTAYSARQYLGVSGGSYSVTVTDPLGNVTTNQYAGDGTLYFTGGAAYPATVERDADGRRIGLRTWRDESDQPDVTRWHYDFSSGLVTNKIYADGFGPSYAYTPDGRLSSRTWARGVETAYSYTDTVSGQIQTAAYSGTTSDVTNRYDLVGRLVSVKDGTGTRSFAYDTRGRVTAETNALAVIAHEYNALGLPSNFTADSDDGIAYAYDSLMRMTNISAGILSFDFGYLPQTRLQAYAVNSFGIGWRRIYEEDRNLIASVTNFSGATTVAAFGYLNDSIGRRIARNNDTFAYNARSELTSALMNAGYEYGYDGIGNLVFSAAGTVTNAYMANALNQYSSITGGTTASPAYDADGNTTWDGRFAHTWDAENRLTRSQPGGIVTNGAVLAENSYDYQNRRVKKTVKQLSGRGSGYPLDPSQAGTWDIISTRTFLYDGWNLYREVESVGGAAVTNIYIWGPDLSGTQQGAGGVGGLLAVLRNGTPYFPCYDANGNVTDYVDANGSVVAHREYGPFGRTTVATGPLVYDLHFWFSTKYLDEETGLYYYGERYYSPQLMRWLNRDPIKERGGNCLYGFVGNDPANKLDPLGLFIVRPVAGSPRVRTTPDGSFGGMWASVVILPDDNGSHLSGIVLHMKHTEIHVTKCDGTPIADLVQTVQKRLPTNNRAVGRMLESGHFAPIYSNVAELKGYGKCVKGEILVKAVWYHFAGPAGLPPVGFTITDNLSGSLDNASTHGVVGATSGWPAISSGSYTGFASLSIVITLRCSPPFYDIKASGRGLDSTRWERRKNRRSDEEGSEAYERWYD